MTSQDVLYLRLISHSTARRKKIGDNTAFLSMCMTFQTEKRISNNENATINFLYFQFPYCYHYNQLSPSPRLVLQLYYVPCSLRKMAGQIGTLLLRSSPQNLSGFCKKHTNTNKHINNTVQREEPKSITHIISITVMYPFTKC